MAKRGKSVAEAAKFNWIKHPWSNDNVTIYTCYFSDDSFAQVREFADGTVSGHAMRGYDMVGDIERAEGIKPLDAARELEGAIGCWTHAYKVFFE